MKRVMLMWLLMLSVSFVACSEGGPEEEPTPKPEIDYTEDITAHIDANFAKELQRHKLIANALRITRADVCKIEKIDFVYGDLLITYDPITSLRGIEYFESLKKLRCDCHKLTSVDLSRNPLLEEVSLEQNQLSSVQFGANDCLKWVYLTNNKLSSLDFSQCPELRWLYCGQNSSLGALNISSCTKLERLVALQGKLKSLAVDHCPNLEWLHVGVNALTKLDVKQNPKLQLLHCEGNPISEIDMGGNAELTEFDCSSCQIKKLNISNNRKLNIFTPHWNPGEGGRLVVEAWFDDQTKPDFIRHLSSTYEYNGQTVVIEYRKVAD